MSKIKKPWLKKPGIKKPLKTIKENSKWKNIETINIKTRKIAKNKDLEKLTENWKLVWYEVVNPKDKEKYLRSKKDKTKKNNLDPKIAINKPKKIGNKRVIKSPRKIKIIYNN